LANDETSSTGEVACSVAAASTPGEGNAIVTFRTRRAGYSVHVSAQATRISRRVLLGSAIGGAAALAVGSRWVPDLVDGASPRYAALGPANSDGVRLPAGFSSKLIARSGERVPGTDYVFHEAPDGAAVFPAPDGGWIYVSNSENTPGGAGALRFDSAGRITGAQSILEGTAYNCSGGATPWGTWLSCEEVPYGAVWECDPFGTRKAVKHPAMGLFKHEAAAVDPVTKRVFMTEDLADGRLYRFTPERWKDLSAGRLDVATVHGERVMWTEVPDPLGRDRETRFQVDGSTPFMRAEGIYRVGRTIYISTTADSRMHAYDIDRERIRVIYDGREQSEPALIAQDQMTASPAGELFVAEDNGRPEQAVSTIDPPGAVKRFLTISGANHAGSELSGLAFSPDGRRLYFSSQRAYGSGAVYEVRGPFRRGL
jgi:Alkaline phosphatase PhoX/WD40-like Beta Propeller Repeat